MEVVAQWLSGVKEWAAGGKQKKHKYPFPLLFYILY